MCAHAALGVQVHTHNRWPWTKSTTGRVTLWAQGPVSAVTWAHGDTRCVGCVSRLCSACPCTWSLWRGPGIVLQLDILRAQPTRMSSCQ